ncbi:hypothetical protein [Cupriavidus sp. CP313]
MIEIGGGLTLITGWQSRWGRWPWRCSSCP